MAARRRYRKKPDQYVVAVQLSLETEGFTYKKWGAQQRCKPGDWLVNNQGDVYTVDQDSFAATYRQKRPDLPGIYVKTTVIWAERAAKAGEVVTKEGISRYHAGDYLVANKADGSDAYCISASKFESMYEPVE
jgi:hypothetical protein